MRKKYLSALLFGALLFASAGTFTSCKDYDDDINGLREDVTSLQNAVTTLQNAVESGKYVSAVSNNGNTITFTFTDGTTTDITLEDEKGSVVTVNEDGVLCIDGKPTDIKAAADPTPGEEHKDQIIIENNMWSVLQEDGTYKSTGIPVSGINVAGSEADGYTFTIYKADGTPQTVKLPSVASSITNIDFSTAIVTNTGVTMIDGTSTPAATDFTWATTTFNLTDGANVNNFKASDWKGNKALPANESVVLSSESEIDVRIDPVGTDATLIAYTLTNTLNQDASNISLKAEAEDGEDPLTTTEVAGRAGNLGNGLYTLSMDNKVLSKTEAESVVADLQKIGDDDAYAVNAAHAIRSKYALTINEAEAPMLSKLKLKQGDTEVTTTDLNDEQISASTATIKVGVPVQVSGDKEKAVYDIYMEVAPEDAKFNVTFDQDKHTFTIGQNPDWATVTDVQVPIIIWTVATDGTVNKTTVTVTLDSEFSTNSNYQPITHTVVTKLENNVQYIDLQTMKNGFKSQDDLDSWTKNVDLTNVSYQIYTDEKCEDEVTGIDKLKFATIKDKKYDANDSDKLTGKSGASANFIRMRVLNSGSDDLVLDKQYYLKVSYTDGSNTLNSFVVPVTFTAPSVAEQFVVSDNYQNGSANAILGYYNNWSGDTNTRKIDMVHFFKSYDKGATLALDDQTVVTEYKSVEYTAKDLATLSTANVEDALISLNTADASSNSLVLTDGTNREVGYGKVLTINASNANFKDTDWKYTDEADTKCSLTITVLSPIYEGVIAATDGSKNLSVVVNNEGGANITANMISLTDYANNKYNVVPDLSGTAYNNAYNTADGTASGTAGDDIWEAQQIQNVWVNESGDNNYLRSISLQDETKNHAGAVVMIAQPIADFTEPTEVTVHVKDVWGYVTSQPLSITLTKAE